ncbi:MAG: circadian clock protein KaiC [Phycisphaerales bacterium]
MKTNTQKAGRRHAGASRNGDLPSVEHGPSLEKAPTGIEGLDQITNGGLPAGRPTLVCGGAGCGKTLLGVEFLVRGAVKYGEPGLFVSFEENAEELAKNVASLGFDLKDLERRKLLIVDHVRVERGEIEETGEYDLEGLFVRLGYSIDEVGAKRVVLDTIESLFSGLSNTAILRAELRRLFHWLKDKGVTAVITGERGEGQLTRQWLEEYVSDCVILMDHRVIQQISTRRLRIVKYRGSTHGTNEYPFLIDADGISVLPITSLGLSHGVSDERVPTGIARLDTMLAGGYFRGSSVLVSGTAGTGKSSMAAHFADATCRAGESCLYFAFEESEALIIRNMRSIGIDLEPHVRAGLLKFFASRPSLHGLEMHLAVMHREIGRHRPRAVVLDPISNLVSQSNPADTLGMLVRLIDFLKEQEITGVFTSLNTGGPEPVETSEVGISSLMDSWILLRDMEAAGERNRLINVVKSRGTAHSNQVREFLLTDNGVQIRDMYLGPGGVLTGSARRSQEARDAAAERDRSAELERREAQLTRKRAELDAEIEEEARALERLRRQEAARVEAERELASTSAAQRRVDTGEGPAGGGPRRRSGSARARGARS